MFTVVQLPLTDARPFLDAPSGRITAFVWPIVHVPEESYKAPFVRGFGRARRRLRGGVDEWPAEDAYCDVSNALRFARTVRKSQTVSLADDSRTYCAFRRLFWDGRFRQAGAVVGRVEVGFGLRLGTVRGPLQSGELGRFLDELLLQDVSVTGGSARGNAGDLRRKATTTLGESGSALAKAYLRASTTKDALAALEERQWWVQSGTPLVIVEYAGEQEVDALPEAVQPVALSGAPFGGIRVFLGRRHVKGRECPVWFFEGGTTGRERESLRRLRINVTRLYAALNALQILSDLQLKQRIARTSVDAKRNLANCLSSYLPFLYQKEYQGFDWTDFLRAALTLSETMTPGRMTTLRELHPAPGRGLSAQLDNAEIAVVSNQPTPAPVITWDIFLAHDSADKALAEQLYNLLKDATRVFFDAKSVQPGDEFDTAIRDAQQRSFMTVVLIGPEGDRAYYMRSEIQTAIAMSRLDAQRHRVVPVYLEGMRSAGSGPYGLNLKQGIELTKPADLPAVAERILATWRATRPATS